MAIAEWFRKAAMKIVSADTRFEIIPDQLHHFDQSMSAICIECEVSFIT